MGYITWGHKKVGHDIEAEQQTHHEVVSENPYTWY